MENQTEIAIINQFKTIQKVPHIYHIWCDMWNKGCDIY